MLSEEFVSLFAFFFRKQVVDGDRATRAVDDLVVQESVDDNRRSLGPGFPSQPVAGI